jgi:Crp-like helix-turn-helix domain
MVEDLSLRTVVARVARLLVDRARGTRTLIEEPATSKPEHTQDEIAAMVGSVREVVQRALKTLEQVGLIQWRADRFRSLIRKRWMGGPNPSRRYWSTGGPDDVVDFRVLRPLHARFLSSPSRRVCRAFVRGGPDDGYT